jgi:hypothetical protein
VKLATLSLRSQSKAQCPDGSIRAAASLTLTGYEFSPHTAVVVKAVGRDRTEQELATVTSDGSGTIRLDLPARRIPVRDQLVGLVAEGQDLEGGQRRLFTPVAVTESC